MSTDYNTAIVDEAIVDESTTYGANTILIAKYKFDSSIYADLIPEFNSEFTSDLYTVTDEVDSENSNYIIRTIESDSLPTLMRFGRVWVEGETTTDNRTDSLLEVLDINTSGLTNCHSMFRYNTNLISITCNWNTSNVTNMNYMFCNCSNLTSLDVSSFGTAKVARIDYMFYNCSKLTNLDVSGFDTSKVANMDFMFNNCSKLTSLDLSGFDTSNVTQMQYMFQNCSNLTSLDVSRFDTSNVTNMYGMFQNCSNLTSLDISNFDTSKVTDSNNILTSCASLKYIKCNNISTLNTLSTLLPTKSSTAQGTIICKSDTTNLDVTTLQSKYWTINTNPTLIAKYKYDSTIYKNLIPEFNEGYMGFVEDEEVDENGVVTRKIEHVELPTKVIFGTKEQATTKQDSLLSVIYCNVINCTRLDYCFKRCCNLTEANIINTNNVTYMGDLFSECTKLKKVNTLDWDVDKVSNFYAMFYSCYDLNELDLSTWNTKNLKSFDYTFYGCIGLEKIDLSNFNLNIVSNTSETFKSVKSLTDIGMIYCDQSTINKVASLLPSDTNRTIWVESDDILQYNQYDHITYKTQKVQDTVHLNSPLLKGDTIEVIDGKTYHVHRYGKIVFDGSTDEGWWYSYPDDWWSDTEKTVAFHSYVVPPNSGYNLDMVSTRFLKSNYDHIVTSDYEGISRLTDLIVIRISKSKLNSLDKQGFEQWLQDNPTTVVYELATPYYELISEEPLELTLLDTTDNTINNNSILPSNMTIANKELSTIAIKPSTTYTLSFDKSNEDSEVTIDICGGEQITTVLNRVELTTPSKLGSGIRFISTDGCIISNVRLLEGSLVKEAIPKETFEGLKSSFEEGYIIGDFLGTADSMTLINTKNELQASDDIIYLSKTIKAKNPITLIFNTDIAHSNIRIGCYGNGAGSGFYNSVARLDKIGFTKYLVIPTIDITVIRLVNYSSNSAEIGDMAKISNVVVLEGDHTHLSEAELMRYIEKGTSHYEEEDYNHVGKYKVQYKVTGKNKFDKNKFLDLNSNYEFMSQNIYKCKSIQLKPNTTYTISKKYADTDLFLVLLNVSPQVNKVPYFDLRDGSNSSTTYTTLDDGKLYIGSGSTENLDTVLDRIQIEEGSTLTEYEPYKEDIKTYYLSSPLLEGDTIEDINGVATHVKRYEKVVLDGSKNWAKESVLETTVRYALNNTAHNFLQGTGHNGIKAFSNYNIGVYAHNNTDYIHFHFEKNKLNFFMDVKYENMTTFKSMLNENPLIVVAKLASPIYEPISTESILCDSYVNGHLDVDTNIPIEKVYFDYLLLALKYVKPSTRYLLQFESDNVGISTINIGGSTVSEVSIIKGINKVEITTLPTLTHQLLAFSGIGFNASNIQVVEANEDIEFGYFKGLQSSFEDGLVTNENDENYGKYKVECKIVGKNKFDGEYEKGYIDIKKGFVPVSSSEMYTTMWIKCKPNTTYIVKANYETSSYKRNRWLLRNNSGQETIIGGTTGNETPKITTLNDTTEFRVYFKWEGDPTNVKDITKTLQIEEGTQATSYEPYKESIHTLYLNSPLLKDDKLVVHDGKLCHYHKMGMVVLDGSENWKGYENPNASFDNCICRNLFIGNMQNSKDVLEVICDKFSYVKNGYLKDVDNISTYTSTYFDNNHIYIRINKNKCTSTDSFKQWLSENPTTVVYELAEPYYEPIEPQISQYSFSTVKDGDMEIITALPIEIDLTYRTDINGVSSIEEQIASIQESTDISSIIDEEVDE